MHCIRRAAVAAPSFAISPVFRSQTARAHVLPSGFRTSAWKPQQSSSFLSAFRAYATEPEKSDNGAAQAVSDAASQAIESLKGTAEATQAFSSEAASDASEATSQATATAQDTASSTAETVSDTTQHVADSILAQTPARSSQSTSIRAEGRRQGQEPSSSLYLGNLYFEVSQKALEEEFSRFGEVKSVKLIYDGRGLSKGFGYVDFESTAQATAALEALDQQVFEGRRMTVQFAIAKKIPLQPIGTDGFRHAPSKTLYIGNMSYEMSDKDLNDLFREVKNVTDVRVAIDRRTGQPRGYAHADFVDVESATQAAEYLKAKQFYGRSLRIDYTHSKTTNRTPSQTSTE